MPQTLSLTHDGPVAHIELCRPDEMNTMNLAFWQEVVEIFGEIDRTPSARCVVLSAQGKHFTAGLDLGEFATFVADVNQGDPGRVRERIRRTVVEMQQSFNVIEECRVPVIAAIQGACIGGGVDMTSACDLRTCTANAFFRIQEINVGMTPDVGTLQRLPYLIPDGLARELAYTGRKMFADEALAAGLVNRVFEGPEPMMSWAMETARAIASKSPLAVVGTKEMLNYGRDHSVQDGLRHVATWQAGMLVSADLMEHMMARQQRRDPDFEDLLPPRGFVRRG